MSSGVGGFLGTVLGGALTGGAGPAIGAGIQAALPGVADTAKILVDRLVPDPAAKAAAQAEVEKALAARDVAAIAAAQEIAKAQTDINLAEAQGNDRYSSRWRPTAGWVCVFGLAYQFVAAPILTWATNILGAAIGAAIPPAPTLSISDLMFVATGMLGLGTMRTIERTQGVPGAMPTGVK